MQGGNQVLLGDRAFLEILFQQLVFALGHEFDQGFVAGLGVGGQAVGNLAGDFAASVSVGGVIESLHGHQVNHAVESLCVRNWQLDRNTVAAPALDQVIDQ